MFEFISALQELTYRSRNFIPCRIQREMTIIDNVDFALAHRADRIPDSCRRVSFDTRKVSFDSPWTATYNGFLDCCPHFPDSFPGLRTALMHRVASVSKKSFLKGIVFVNSDCDCADIRWALLR